MDAPNAVWTTDFKGQFRTKDGVYCYPPYPARLPPLEYPAHYEVRRVSTNGGIKWHDRWVNVTHLLGMEYIGLEEIGDGLWQVYFATLKLGRFDERLTRIIADDGTTSRNPRRLLPMSSD